MSVSSYGNGTESSGTVRILKDLDVDIAGKNVLIVEDIIDSGLTLSNLVKELKIRNPKSLKLCTLLDKPQRRTSNIPVDYVGFVIEDKFIVGYGYSPLMLGLAFSIWINAILEFISSPIVNASNFPSTYIPAIFSLSFKYS